MCYSVIQKGFIMYVCKKCGWSGDVSGRQRCLACYRISVKKWRVENPDKVKQQKARHNLKFKTERREEFNARRRRLRNVQCNLAAYKTRLAWLLSGSLTRAELLETWEQDHGLCYLCGVSVMKPRFNPYDMRGFDHVVPRANGGVNEKVNIRVCCAKCNTTKSDKEGVKK